MGRRRLLAVLALAASPLAASTDESTRREGVLAGARHPWLKWPDLSDVAADLQVLYAGEEDGLVWFEGGSAHAATGAAVEALAAADERGLSPEDYDAPLLLVRFGEERAGTGGGEARRLFDLALSASFLRHLGDVHRGRVDPRLVDFEYDAHGGDHDRPALLREARDQGKVAVVIAALEPQIAPYRRLKAALRPWRELVKGAPLPEVPEVRKLQPGAAYEGTAALAARLAAFGDLAADAFLPGAVYEGALVDAVKRFQARLGLDTDGTLGPATLRALNASPAARLQQIELGLERMRWLPDLRGREVVVVDIPAFLLWAFASDEKPDLVMPVVVGKALRHDTPLFFGEMKHLNFQPYWNVPPSIARNEIVPRLRRDSGYLDREGLELVAVGSGDGPAPTFPPTTENVDRLSRGQLRVRQRPGPRNALGHVKFLFPNEDNIYLHDTPSRSLFARSRRDFSHGCIRLGDPAALARWVLRHDPDWPRERIAEALAADRPQWVSLKSPIPVALVYATAFVDSEGRTRFFEDIYGHDARLLKALAGGYPFPRTSAP